MFSLINITYSSFSWYTLDATKVKITEMSMVIYELWTEQVYGLMHPFLLVMNEDYFQWRVKQYMYIFEWCL